MPEKRPEDSQVVSVRLSHKLIQRLDRYLDWSEIYARVKLSRNAALREALSNWLNEHEQRVGFLEPDFLRRQFEAAYQSFTKGHDWVAIEHLRQLLPWPCERFDTVVEALRADHQVELERAEPGEMSERALQESYKVHGQFYRRLRWRG